MKNNCAPSWLFTKLTKCYFHFRMQPYTITAQQRAGPSRYQTRDIRSTQQVQWHSGMCAISTVLQCWSLHRPRNDRLCPIIYFRIYFPPHFKTFSLVSYFICQIFSPEGFPELTYDGYRPNWMLSCIAPGTNNLQEPPKSSRWT